MGVRSFSGDGRGSSFLQLLTCYSLFGDDEIKKYAACNSEKRCVHPDADTLKTKCDCIGSVRLVIAAQVNIQTGINEQYSQNHNKDSQNDPVYTVNPICVFL